MQIFEQMYQKLNRPSHTSVNFQNMVYTTYIQYILLLGHIYKGKKMKYALITCCTTKCVSSNLACDSAVTGTSCAILVIL